MFQPAITERQLRALRYLVQCFQSDEPRADVVRTSEVPRDKNETDGDIDKMLEYFARRHWVKWDTLETVVVKQEAANFLERLDHPESKNHLTEWTVWWFSSRWRSAITVMTIGLPLIVQWIEMVQSVLRWFGILTK